MVNVTRRLHQPHKCGPVLRPDRSRGQVGVQTRSVPQWDPDKGIWEWWYWASYRVAPYGPHQSTAVSLTHYATSIDGVRWETPPLGLHEWRGTKANNVAYDPARLPKTLYHIVRDQRDPDTRRRYKGLFGSEGRRPGVSADGFTWQMRDDLASPNAPVRIRFLLRNAGLYAFCTGPRQVGE